jgi:hypothetical protein
MARMTLRPMLLTFGQLKIGDVFTTRAYSHSFTKTAPFVAETETVELPGGALVSLTPDMFGISWNAFWRSPKTGKNHAAWFADFADISSVMGRQEGREGGEPIAGQPTNQAFAAKYIYSLSYEIGDSQSRDQGVCRVFGADALDELARLIDALWPDHVKSLREKGKTLADALAESGCKAIIVEGAGECSK